MNRINDIVDKLNELQLVIAEYDLVGKVVIEAHMDHDIFTEVLTNNNFPTHTEDEDGYMNPVESVKMSTTYGDVQLTRNWFAKSPK